MSDITTEVNNIIEKLDPISADLMIHRPNPMFNFRQ